MKSIFGVIFTIILGLGIILVGIPSGYAQESDRQTVQDGRTYYLVEPGQLGHSDV